MPRHAREESATGYYHVMMRGINREYIYRFDSHKEYFLELVGEEEALQLAAYCLMDNHVHLVLRAELVELAAAMKRINVKYAMHYNTHLRRVGHVFQNRYKSEVIDTDTYLMQVVRYVHNNPVKARMVTKVEDHKWSSYGDYMESATTICQEQKEFVLAYFSDNIDRFKQFHLEDDEQEYLDIKEDIEFNRLQRAQAVITDFCRRHGIVNGMEVRENLFYLEEIISLLLDKTQLSHRKIARLLEINPNQVHKVSKRRKQK